MGPTLCTWYIGCLKICLIAINIIYINIWLTYLTHYHNGCWYNQRDQSDWSHLCLSPTARGNQKEGNLCLHNRGKSRKCWNIIDDVDFYVWKLYLWFIPHNALAEKVAQEQSPQSETISNCPERNNQDWTDQIDGKFRSHGIHFCDCWHRHKVRAWAGPCDISLAEGACTCDICTGSN